MSEPRTTIDCDALDERLLDYLYEEIPDEERRAIDAHVAGCARCAAELAAFRRVQKAARALPLEEPSPNVSARLLEAAAGRNVVPLPLFGRDGEPLGADGDAEPSLQATERILAAARARVAAAAAPEAPAAARAMAMEASVGAAASSAGGATPIGSAAKSARRRRWYTSPSLTAAASFLLVGAGTAWFLSFNREPQMEMAAAPTSATPPTAAAPSAAPQAAPPVEVARKSLPPGEPLAEAEAPAVEKKVAHADKLPREALAKLEERSAEAAGPSVLGAVGRGAGAGGGGMGTGFGTTGVGLGRAGQPGGAAPPAPARKPEGAGITLHADEQAVLERSVAAAAAADSARKEADGARAEAQRADRAAYASPPAAAAAPPPPPAPRSRASAALDDKQDEGGLAAIGGAVPMQGNKGAAAAAPSATTAPRDVASTQAEPSLLARKLSCRDYLAAFQARRGTNDATGPERMRAADCYAETGQLGIARAEYTALRASHPELGSQVAARLDRLGSLEQQSELAQRRAADQGPPAARAKAAPAKAKAGKAAAEQAAPASPTY